MSRTAQWASNPYRPAASQREARRRPAGWQRKAHRRRTAAGRRCDLLPAAEGAVPAQPPPPTPTPVADQGSEVSGGGAVALEQLILTD